MGFNFKEYLNDIMEIQEISTYERSFSQMKVVFYKNGGVVTIRNGVIERIKYNTGDEIWLTETAAGYIVYQLKTSTGIVWKASDDIPIVL